MCIEYLNIVTFVVEKAYAVSILSSDFCTIHNDWSFTFFCLFFNRCPVQYTGKRCEMIDTDYLLALFGVSNHTCRHSFKMKYTWSYINRFPFEDNLDILTTRSHWKRVLQFIYEISYLLKCSTCQRHAIIFSYFLNKSQDIILKKIPNNLNTNFTIWYLLFFLSMIQFRFPKLKQ